MTLPETSSALPPAHPLTAPSDWVRRWAHLVPVGGPVLDVACGAGRHLRFFAERGHAVCGIDRDIGAARSLASALPGGAGVQPALELLEADIESGPWPLNVGTQPRRFAGVVVTNYLWRPLFSTLLDSVAEGGVLLYETFARGHETVGRPSRPEFLLQTGELLQRCAGLQVVAFEQGFLSGPDRFVQRIAAVRPSLPRLHPGAVHRYSLSG